MSGRNVKVSLSVPLEIHEQIRAEAERVQKPAAVLWREAALRGLQENQRQEIRDAALLEMLSILRKIMEGRSKDDWQEVRRNTQTLLDTLYQDEVEGDE